jgi:hypothetical protein
MRMGWTTVALLGALGGWAGCGDDDGDVPIDAGSDATIEDAGGIDAWMRGDAGTTASWTVTVRDLISGNRLQLAEVCVVDVPQLPCAITDTEGRATLDVPIDLELQLRTTALRYVPTVTTYVSDAEPRSVGVDMPPNSALPLLGGRVDPDKGQLAFVVQNEAGDGLAGVSATIDPASGTGPRFTDGSLPDDTLTATTEDGLGLFVNVDPGRVSMTFEGAECEPNEAWPSASGTLEVRVEAGSLMIVTARCATETSDAGVDGGASDAGSTDAGLDGGV